MFLSNIMPESVEYIHCDDDVNCYGHLTETEIIDVLANINSDINVQTARQDEEDEVDLVRIAWFDNPKSFVMCTHTFLVQLY